MQPQKSPSTTLRAQNRKIQPPAKLPSLEASWRECTATLSVATHHVYTLQHWPTSLLHMDRICRFSVLLQQHLIHPLIPWCDQFPASHPATLTTSNSINPRRLKQGRAAHLHTRMSTCIYRLVERKSHFGNRALFTVLSLTPPPFERLLFFFLRTAFQDGCVSSVSSLKDQALLGQDGLREANDQTHALHLCPRRKRLAGLGLGA